MIQLTITEKQAQTISQACELYGRLCCGQLDELLDLMPPLQNNPSDPSEMDKKLWFQRREDMRTIIQGARRTFTGLSHQNENYGINSPEISDNARIAYDLHQVIRHHLFRLRNPDPQGSERLMVDNDPPRRTSQEPLASISSVG